MTCIAHDGYSLEGFLNSLFEYEGLKPRGPFKIVGEQIDGSFTWGHRTHLIEARWVKEPRGGSRLLFTHV
jgi:hypothetical protein